ncbi:MAG TPA: MobQ family relaxase [Pseudolabrys sp.]|nr:MobQ family relaxase [Pseudolabrys sp.]
MAIYRLAADIVKRSEGRTVTAAAAYRAGELIIDQRTGYAFDYRRRQGVIETAILAPAGAPAWMHDRVRLWNAVEASEKRKDAQLARDIELALPHELDATARRELVHRFVRAAFVDAGMVADVAMHAPDACGDGRNFHAHILLTMRRIEGGGFGPKERAWNKPEQLETWRAQWAALVNDALAVVGENARVDHRSLEAQGIERLPQIHLGLAVSEMRRRGIATERAELAGAISAANDGLRAAPAEGCNGSARASLPSVLHNTPLALSPRMPARADRLPLFGRASRAFSRREKMPPRQRAARSLARTAISVAGRRVTTHSIAEPVSVRRRSRRPRRPRKLAARANMAAEQRLDYLAACDGKITWGWYFAKWGPSL